MRIAVGGWLGGRADGGVVVVLVVVVVLAAAEGGVVVGVTRGRGREVNGQMRWILNGLIAEVGDKGVAVAVTGAGAGATRMANATLPPVGVNLNPLRSR